MKRTLPNSLVLLLTLTGMICLGGCSTFQRDWETQTSLTATEDAPKKEPPSGEGLLGRWKGSWYSDTTGHDGALRCIITRQEDDSLHARYHAIYGGMLTFEYDMPMTVRQEGDVFHFSAQHDLGWLAGGMYTYDGTVVGDEFMSTYSSKGDNGTFEMQRMEE